MRSYLLANRGVYFPDSLLWYDFVMLYEKTCKEVHDENLAKQGLQEDPS